MVGSILNKSESYCPIRQDDGKCGAGGDCDYINCWEKIHYGKTPKLIEDKFLKWREHRRGEVRWKDKD